MSGLLDARINTLCEVLKDELGSQNIVFERKAQGGIVNDSYILLADGERIFVKTHTRLNDQSKVILNTLISKL